MTSGHTTVRQNQGHNASHHPNAVYRNASKSITSLTHRVAKLCSMPWKRLSLWHNPFNRLHLQVKWRATNQESQAAASIDKSLQRLREETPPRRGGRFSPDWHPQVPMASRVGCLPGQRGTAPLQKVDGFMHGPCETSETGETWTILAWYLYFFIQNWKCRTSTKETKVPPGHPPLPLSTTRLLGTKS